MSKNNDKARSRYKKPGPRPADLAPDQRLLNLLSAGAQVFQRLFSRRQRPDAPVLQTNTPERPQRENCTDEEIPF